MEFQKSETYLNVARSFAGEAQAGLRYQFIADQCTAQGYAELAKEIRILAKNETFHAKQFFQVINDKCGPVPNITFEAGYPFEGGTIEQGLLFATEAERDEFQSIYPSFTKIAEKEGFQDVSALFRMIAEVESQHAVIFEYLHRNFKEGTLYRSPHPMQWRCANCGHMATIPEAWNICPLCKSSQGYVELHLPFKENQKDEKQQK